MYPAVRSFLMVSGATNQGDTMIATQAAPGHGIATAPAECDCGQDLDCCRREHCPRCGREIHHAA
jgi:hypothetical protein